MQCDVLETPLLGFGDGDFVTVDGLLLLLCEGGGGGREVGEEAGCRR